MMIDIIPNWHPVFVHFTVALLSVSLGLFVVNLVVKCDQAVLVAKWNLWIGAGLSLLTLAAGFDAYNTVAHDTPSHEAMTEHKNLALITLALLTSVVAWSVVFHRKGKALGAGFVGLFLLVGGMLASTAWHGGELVYRYGLGVMSLPNTDKHDHAAHAHDGGHGDDHGAHAHAHDGEHSDDHDMGKGHTDSGHGHDGLADDHGMDMDMDMGEMSMDDMGMQSTHKNPGHHDDGHDHAH